MRNLVIASTLLLSSVTLSANLPFDTMQAYLPENYYHYHVASAIFFPECKLDFEDGSQWKISEDDRLDLLSWRIGDSVILTPNRGFNHDFTYYLTNQANGSYVRVNLVRGPLANGPRTMMIHGLDANSRYKRAVHLNNGTSWRINDADLNLIDNWQVGDAVIIGHNDGWFACCGTILINVVTNTFVRAKKI